jgi:hypothetical protein
MTKEKMTKGKWLEENGFSIQGITYIVMGNSFAIKEELKENKFKFSPLLLWHGPHDKYILPSDCTYLKLYYDDYFYWDGEEGVSYLQEGAREKLDAIFNPLRESKSEHIGTVGDKIEDLYCEVVATGGYQSAYGYKWIYTFRDENENEYSWFTTVNKALTKGMWVILSGSIKEHSNYKGVKTTVLTRCKVDRTV